MKRSPEAKAYARRMFRVCTVLAAIMLLLTLYWWLIGDGHLVHTSGYSRGNCHQHQCGGLFLGSVPCGGVDVVLV